MSALPPAPAAPPARVAPRAGRRRTGRPWGAIVLAPLGEGATRRRGSDAFRVGAASLAVLCCWLVTLSDPSSQKAIVGAVVPPPDGVRWLVGTLMWVGSVGVIALLVAAALLWRRRAMARDLAVAGLGAWVLSFGLSALVGPDPSGASETALGGVNPGFPVGRLAATVAVALVALPYLSRAFQRLIEALVLVALLSAIVHGAGLPVAVLASLALGWGAAAAVHLAFGSPLGLPSSADVGDLLADLGVTAEEVAPAAHQVWGVARFVGRDAGGALDVSVYGRDAHDAQLLAKAFRFLAYRDSGPTLTVTRAQQVEHEAYLTLLSGRTGARVPEVLAAGTAGPASDAVLATHRPRGTRLGELVVASGHPVSEADGDDLLRQVLALRRAGIAHGSINGDTVVVADQGGVGLVDFRSATASAPGERLDRDTAAALATLAWAAGVERALASARRVLPVAVLASALPFLQRAALNPGLSRALRGHKALLVELRQGGSEAAEVAVPKLAEPRRISWVNLAVVIGSVIGGWALIGVLINVSKSWSTITGARWGWVAATFLLAQLAYPTIAVTTVGSVTDPLPYGRVVALEVANSFVALAGGSMGTLATRVRFFQQDGYDATLAVSSAVVASTASWLVKGVLFLVALPLAVGQLHVQEPAGGAPQVVWLLILVVVGSAVLVGAVFAVPRLRRLAADKLRPKASEVWGHLKILAGHPKNLVEIFGGGAAAQVLVALALGTALHAFDQRLSLATLLVVLTLASILGGVSPVPGGMGVVEAGMILGLTAAGIPQSDAVAATFVQRLFTSYLPPIWGWFVLVWMRRRDYL